MGRFFVCENSPEKKSLKSTQRFAEKWRRPPSSPICPTCASRNSSSSWWAYGRRFRSSVICSIAPTSDAAAADANPCVNNAKTTTRTRRRPRCSSISTRICSTRSRWCPSPSIISPYGSGHRPRAYDAIASIGCIGRVRASFLHAFFPQIIARNLRGIVDSESLW